MDGVLGHALYMNMSEGRKLNGSVSAAAAIVSPNAQLA